MSNFIQVTDAITGNQMIIKKDIIATIERSLKTCDGKSCTVSKITFTIDRLDEYVTESIHYFKNVLCNS